MNLEYTKHISGHSLKHYINLSVLRYNINMVMENYARQLKAKVESFEKELGTYIFEKSPKGNKFIVGSSKFDRKGLLNFLQKKLSKVGAKYGLQGDQGPSSPKIGSTIGGLYFQLPREGESPFEKYIIEDKDLPGQGKTKVSTEDQENYSALCVAARLNDRNTVYNLSDLEKYSSDVFTNQTQFVKKDVKDLFDNKVTSEWKDSSKFQVDLLFKKVKFKFNYTIERQREGPITKYIYSQALKFIKELAETSPNFAIFKKLAPDKWNPGDIWIIDKTLSKSDFEMCKSLKHLNERILHFFEEGRMYPVSLKQAVAPNPPFEISNDGKENFYSIYKNHNLGTAKGTNGFNTKNNNMRIEFTTKNSTTKEKEAIVRPFTGKIASFEIEGVSAKGGKVGLGFLNKVLKTMKFSSIIDFKTIDSKAKKNLNGTYLELFNKVLKLKNRNNNIFDGKIKVSLKKNEFDRFFSLIVNSVKNKPKDRGQLVAYINAKFQAVDLAQRFESMTTKQKDEFIDRAVTYASSTIRQVSSVFIKVGN